MRTAHHLGGKASDTAAASLVQAKLLEPRLKRCARFLDELGAGYLRKNYSEREVDAPFQFDRPAAFFGLRHLSLRGLELSIAV